MLDIKAMVQNPEAVKRSLTVRRQEELSPLVDSLLSLDKERREGLQKVEAWKHHRNQASQQIAIKKQKKEPVDDVLSEMKKLADQIKAEDELVAGVDSKMEALLLKIPNVLHPSVPEGTSSNDNVEIRKWGTPRTFDFTPLPHDELGEKLGILDFKKASEVSGARFVFLKGQGARLERALIQFMLETNLKHGYEEIHPPFIVNEKTLLGSGHLPKFAEDLFKLEQFPYYLIPTAEVPLTSYHCHEILAETDLPKHYTAYTPCFRSEAGSYGKDTKGLKRQHQFEKVELVKMVKPEDSEAALEAMLADACRLLELLKLPYRVMLLCGQDTGFSSSKTYDIEVWSPVSKNYMEISSCSNCTDFQARRAGIRFRSSTDKKVHFVHTLNGSALAVGRTLLAILENNQKSDGTFSVPDVLNSYF